MCFLCLDFIALYNFFSVLNEFNRGFIFMCIYVCVLYVDISILFCIFVCLLLLNVLLFVIGTVIAIVL